MHCYLMLIRTRSSQSCPPLFGCRASKDPQQPIFHDSSGHHSANVGLGSRSTLSIEMAVGTNYSRGGEREREFSLRCGWGRLASPPMLPVCSSGRGALHYVFEVFISLRCCCFVACQVEKDYSLSVHCSYKNQTFGFCNRWIFQLDS